VEYDDPSADRLTLIDWARCSAPVPPGPAKQPTTHVLVPPAGTLRKDKSLPTVPCSVPVKGAATLLTVPEIMLATVPSALSAYSRAES
jgi:hypothetical protein